MLIGTTGICLTCISTDGSNLTCHVAQWLRRASQGQASEFMKTASGGNIYMRHFVYGRNYETVLPILSWKPHCAKKPVTIMLTYPWKCTVLHCNYLGNTWKPLVLMTRHFDYHPR